jgi:hypothetical protein
MKKSKFSLFLSIFLATFLMGFPMACAEEHPGTKVEHPGAVVEHPGKPVTADMVKQTIKDYVESQSKVHKGAFIVRDPELNKVWKLELVKIHDPVREYKKDGKTIYFACSDFKSMESEDILDIDLWLVPAGDRLMVEEVKIHKLNGKARYTYEGTKIKPID